MRQAAQTSSFPCAVPMNRLHEPLSRPAAKSGRAVPALSVLLLQRSRCIGTATLTALFFFLSLLLWATSGFAQGRLWLTDPDHAVYFAEQSGRLSFGSASNGNPTIDVDASAKFQTIDGFGCCLTGGSAAHLMQMDAPDRAALLEELFGTGGTNIGLSYLRVSIGSSDLDAHPFSYDDLPAGQ